MRKRNADFCHYVQIKLASDTDSSDDDCFRNGKHSDGRGRTRAKMTDAENILSEIQASGDVANADIKTIATG